MFFRSVPKMVATVGKAYLAVGVGGAVAGGAVGGFVGLVTSPIAYSDGVRKSYASTASGEVVGGLDSVISNGLHLVKKGALIGGATITYPITRAWEAMSNSKTSTTENEYINRP